MLKNRQQVMFNRGVDNVTMVGNYQDVYLYTEKDNRPISNFCKVCSTEYYVMNKLQPSSIRNSEMILTRCPHSSNVLLYIRKY
jgi:hypothetical protein